MKSFDQWFEEQGQDEPETNCQDGDGLVYAKALYKEAAIRYGTMIHEAIERAGGLKWDEYDPGEFDKPDPDLEHQKGECCGCGAVTEFHNGDYFYCGGSPRCCP